MKKHYLLLFLACLMFLYTKAQVFYQAGNYQITFDNGKYYDETNNSKLEIDPSRIMVKLKNTLSDTQRDNFASRNQISCSGTTRGGISLYKLNQNCNYIQLLNNLSTDSDLISYEINHYYTYFDWWEPPSNDSYRILSDLLSPNPHHLWPYENTQLPEAWQYTYGSSNIVVAVIDNGLFISHPDIGYGVDSYSNLWVNIDEIPNNGIDDDNNCVIDDYNGYNFFTNSGDIGHTTSYIHGTWVSSIISSKTNNEIGTFGVAGGWNSEGCRIMMLNVGNEFTEYEAVEAIEYAVLNGARVINMSWGLVGGYSSYLEQAIKDAYENGRVTFLAAPGNDNLPTVAFPANMVEVIAVGATEQDLYDDPETKWTDHGPNGGFIGSNYGPDLDIAAPGSPIRTESINPFNGTVTYNYTTKETKATSFSTPFASGVVALMLSVDPGLSNEEIFSILKLTADTIGGYLYNGGPSLQLGYGRINAKAAVEASLPLSLQTITGNVVWNDYKRINGNIVIEPNAQLTIESNGLIKMSQYSKVIVKPGGRLIIDGGKITTGYDVMWDGIEVWGNPALSQVPSSNQGFIQVKNEGTIENAVCGIRLYRPDDRNDNKPGGIAICNEANFINNKMSVDIRYLPSVNNVSSFSYCDFVVDLDYLMWKYFCQESGGTPQYPVRQIFDQHVYLRYVKGIDFYANTFTVSNQTSTAYPYTGIGIYSSNSNFNVLPSCNQIPCEDDPSETNSFSGLMYGIYAINDATVTNFRAEYAKFDTYMGIYAGNVNYAKILKNNFIITPTSSEDWAEGRLSTGLYMDVCTGYHVEGNNFIGNTLHGTNNVGVYVKNSGPATNYIYNNRFEKLKYGSIAEGWNYDQYLLKGTGLCYKCNEFYENNFDIKVERSKESLYNGICIYQGYHGTLINDSTPAGNIFSQTAGSYHIDNLAGEHEIKYYFHESSFMIPSIWLVPLKYWNVARFEVKNTMYNKLVSCKSWIGKDILPEDHLLADYNQELLAENDIASNILMLQDGGNTEFTLTSINSTAPYDAFTLRDSLINDSPYLSDTTLKLAVENETVLNNSLLRDILVANPHAGKSNSILERIDRRFQPMSDEMYLEVLESAENDSPYSNLLESYYMHNHDKWLRFNELSEMYVNDSIVPNSIQKLENLVNLNNSISTDLLLIKYYIGKELIDDALARITLLSDRFENAQKILTLQTQLHDYTEIYQSFLTTGIIDSLPFIKVKNISIYGEYPVNSWATNLLNYYTGNILPEEFVHSTPGELKNTRVKPIALKNSSSIMTISPNPAKDYIIVSYSIQEEYSKNKLKIWSIDGKLKDEISIIGSINQKTVDVRSLNSGIYILEITSNNISLGTCKLEINR